MAVGYEGPYEGQTDTINVCQKAYGSEDMPVHYLIVFPFNDDERIDTDEQRS